uniref:Uncharacterized protein n=1 Tax=Physcomitrium patens TaxID=3218 RepID=A0A7I3Z779_PHYPA
MCNNKIQAAVVFFTVCTMLITTPTPLRFCIVLFFFIAKLIQCCCRSSFQTS